MNTAERKAVLQYIKKEYGCGQLTPLDQICCCLSGMIGIFNTATDSERLTFCLSEKHQMELAERLLPHVKYSWDGERLVE